MSGLERQRGGDLNGGRCSTQVFLASASGQAAAPPPREPGRLPGASSRPLESRGLQVEDTFSSATGNESSMEGMVNRHAD